MAQMLHVWIIYLHWGKKPHLKRNVGKYSLHGAFGIQNREKYMEWQGVPISRVIWVFPKIGVPQNGWCIMKIPIKMDDLGVPPFSETPIYITPGKLIYFRPFIGATVAMFKAPRRNTHLGEVWSPHIPLKIAPKNGSFGMAYSQGLCC